METLYWAVPVLFALALQFAILVWCRTWRREDDAEMDRRIRLLTSQVTRVSEVVDRLEKAQTAARSAEARTAQQLESLSADLSRLLSHSSPPSSPSRTSPPGPQDGGPQTPRQDPQDRYEKARELLSSGVGPVEVARQLDVSLGDVQVIQRLLDLQPKKP